MQRCNAVLNKHFKADGCALHSLSPSFQNKMGHNSSKSKRPKNIIFYRVLRCLCAHTTPPVTKWYHQNINIMTNVEYELFFSRILQQ